MRRRFNPKLLPKEPPEKYSIRNKNIGSPFNKWFRVEIEKLNLNMKEFCKLSGANYRTAMGWRYKTDPHIDGRVRIAKTFSELQGIEYKEMFALVSQLCGKWYYK